jgi:hypothetical protein
MKRKYKETQKLLDEAVLSAIKSGTVSNEQLKQVLVQKWKDYSVGELVDHFASTELSAIKQRLRTAGSIEIVKGNQPCLADQLSQEDIEFIDSRRAAHVSGELKTMIEFNANHLRPDRARLAQLAAECLTATEPIEAVPELSPA